MGREHGWKGRERRVEGKGKKLGKEGKVEREGEWQEGEEFYGFYKYYLV